MANANAIVDQMVSLGLRHGEKAGMVLASMIFFVCVGTAATQKGIQTTPDQVKKAAEQSDSNLNRREEREAILKTLEERDKITKTNFAESVEEQIKVSLVPDNYKPEREWVTPEPGAGLIRDTPKLVAVNELYAYPGRGGLLVFALDEKTENGSRSRKAKRTRRRSSVSANAAPEEWRRHGGRDGRRRPAEEEESQAQGRDRTRGEGRAGGRGERLARSSPAVAGWRTPRRPRPTPRPKRRWPLQGDHQGIPLGGAHGHPRPRADARLLSRGAQEPRGGPSALCTSWISRGRVLQPDGTWTDWQDVDIKKNLEVLDNLPEKEDELAPETVLPKELVDTLPFLKAGYWEKVHIASLVPKEKVALPDEKAKGAWLPAAAWVAWVA